MQGGADPGLLAHPMDSPWRAVAALYMYGRNAGMCRPWGGEVCFHGQINPTASLGFVSTLK